MLARQFFKDTLQVLAEPVAPSLRAAQRELLLDHGLVDAAIASAAEKHECAVLTDDLDLYLALQAAGIQVLNFTHLRVASWGQ
jgi:rRNA-processing protein FCF1